MFRRDKSYYRTIQGFHPRRFTAHSVHSQATQIYLKIEIQPVVTRATFPRSRRLLRSRNYDIARKRAIARSEIVVTVRGSPPTPASFSYSSFDLGVEQWRQFEFPFSVRETSTSSKKSDLLSKIPSDEDQRYAVKSKRHAFRALNGC